MILVKCKKNRKLLFFKTSFGQQGSISDMTQTWQAVDYRVVRAKFARDKQREKEEGENPQTSNGDSQKEKEESPKEKEEKEGEESKDSK